MSVGVVRADPDVYLAGIPMQQYLEACQQQHEQRRPLALRARLQPPRQLLRQLDRMASRAVLRPGVTGMIGRQLQHRMLIP